MSRLKDIGLGTFSLLAQAALYAAATRLGWEFVLPHNKMSLLWPAGGVAIALALRGGWTPLAAIFLGSIGMSWLQFDALGMVAAASGAAAAGGIGAALFRRVMASTRLEWVGAHRENLACVTAALFASPVSIAVVSVVLIYIGHLTPQELAQIFWVWWTGDMVGVIIFLPLCLALRSEWIALRSENFAVTLPLVGRRLSFLALMGVVNFVIYSGALEGPAILFAWLVLLLVNSVYCCACVRMALALMALTMAFAIKQDVAAVNFAFFGRSFPSLHLLLGLLALSAMMITSYGRLRLSSWPSLILLGGWGAAHLLYGTVASQQSALEQIRFDQKIQNAESAIVARLKSFSDELSAAAATLEITGGMERSAWNRYAARVRRHEESQGMLGLGVVYPVRREETGDFLRARQGAGLSGFKIRPFPDVIPPPLDDAGYAHFVVGLVEPEHLTDWGLGLDFASEECSQEAARHARDTGEVHATEVMQIMANGRSQPGFMLFQPVYHQAKPRLTEQQRRDAFLGWVFGVFQAERVFALLPGIRSASINYVIFEGLETTPRKVLFHSWERGSQALPDTYERVSRISVLQVDYTIGWTRPLVDRSESLLPAVFGACGTLLASVLLAGLVISLQGFAQRANDQVVERTAELLDSNSRLLTLNQSLRDAERELKAQHREARKHAMIADRTVNAIALSDANRVIEWVNESFTRVTGYRAAEAIGRKPGELIFGPTIDPALVEKFEAGVRTGKVFLLELGCRHKAGTELWLNLEVQPMADEEGRLSGYMYIATDMTEHKSYRLQLEQALHRAEASSRAKTAFLGNISHELRTPLNVISGNATMLSTGRFGVVNASQARALRQVQENSAHLLSLIDDLLDITKAENGRIELVIQAVNVRELCQGVVGMLADAAASKDIRLTAEYLHQSEVIGADPLRVKQVLLNLLSNAVKFTPAGGSVTLRASQTAAPPQIVFQVIDTGFGLNREDQERIFLEFEQASSPLHRSGSGTGLGLPIARRFAQLHGGNLTVESVEGQGSVFTVCLPLVDPPLSEPAAAASVPDPATPPAELIPADFLILAVEDYPANLELLICYLEGEGFRAASAVNGLDAIEQALALKPDLILMDVKMPGMDGLEATRRLKADPRTRDIPVISLTAFASPSDAKACSDAGAADYVTKPIDFLQLGGVISRHLRRSPA